MHWRFEGCSAELSVLIPCVHWSRQTLSCFGVYLADGSRYGMKDLHQSLIHTKNYSTWPCLKAQYTNISSTVFGVQSLCPRSNYTGQGELNFYIRRTYPSFHELSNQRQTLFSPLRSSVDSHLSNFHIPYIQSNWSVLPAFDIWLHSQCTLRHYRVLEPECPW